MSWNTGMGRRRSGTAALAAVVAGLTLVAGCGSSSESTGSGGSGGSGAGGGSVDTNAAFRIAYPVAQSLDPRKAPEPAELLIATWPVYDRLIQLDAQSQYRPMLATSWSFSDGGKTLTLQLRKGVTFSDGTPFDSSAVKANLDWDLAAKNTALQLSVSDIAKVATQGKYAVKLTMVKPSTTVLSALAGEFGGDMISPKALNSPDLDSHPVGTGAYVVTSFKPGQEVTYKRRTDKGGIWDPQTGKPATVTITTMNADAEANSIKSGQIDLTTWSSDLTTFKSQIDQKQLVYTPMQGVLNMVGVNFNKTIKPFDNPLVRKAVNHAINRSAITSAFVAPGNSSRVQPWPDGLPGFEQSREGTYTYDAAKAKALLKQAGYPNGVDAGEMLVAQTGSFPQAATAIQANLAAVGIKIKLRTMDVLSLVSAWAKSKANAELMYMSLPSSDAFSWLQRLFVNPVWTPGGASPQLVKMIAGTDNPSLSDAQRTAQVSKAIQYATDEAIYAPLWQGVGGTVSSPKVRNLSPLASVNGGVGDFRNAYLVK